MNIVVVEDDLVQAEPLLRELSSGLPSLDIRLYDSVAAFLSVLPELDRDPPVFFILDLFLRWCAPEDVLKPSEFRRRIEKEFESGARKKFRPWRAGLFLAKEIRKIEALHSIPMVIWTATDPDAINRSDLDPATQVLRKCDYWMGDMTNHIRSTLIARDIELPKPSARGKALADSVNLRPGAFGISIDLKKIYSALKPKKKRK